MKNELATNLGKIIYRERTRKGISQEQLYRGICTQAVLSKIEHGKKVPEKLLADALMQRLGRCTDTLEVIMSREEYLLFDMREDLRRHFGGGMRRESWRAALEPPAQYGKKTGNTCGAGEEAGDISRLENKECEISGNIDEMHNIAGTQKNIYDLCGNKDKSGNDLASGNEACDLFKGGGKICVTSQTGEKVHATCRNRNTAGNISGDRNKVCICEERTKLPENGQNSTFSQQKKTAEAECEDGHDYSRIRSLLKEYRRSKEAEQPLHRQFLCKYEAINEYRRSGDAQRCCRALGKALNITLPKWRRLKLMQYCLCSQELHLLILLGYFTMDEDAEFAVRLLDEVRNYLEQRYYEEEKVKLYPQCMWLLALHWRREERWEKVEECSSRAVECLSKNGVLPLLAELLRLQLESRERLGRYTGREALEERRVLQNELQSLEAVLRRYADWVLELDDLSRLHFFYHQDEISLDYEMIRDIRRNRGLTQGKLKSCSQPNLSRIESGRQKPTHAHFQEIAKELGVKKSYYISRVQAEDYDLYEMAHWRNQACARMDWEKEAELIAELEGALDMSIPVNQQYIEACHIEGKMYRRKIQPDKGLYQLERILHYTMPDYQADYLRIPSREEFVILDMTIGLMRRQGRKLEGLKLYERLLQVFQESSAREEYHTNSMLILYKNYGGMLEDLGELELAEEMDCRGISLDIQCGKADLIGKILANLGCIYQKSDSPEKYALKQECFWNAYWLCLLMGQSKPAQIIKELL